MNATAEYRHRDAAYAGYDNILDQHLPVHEQLTAWASWQRRRTSYGASGSLEGTYRSPQCWETIQRAPMGFQRDILRVEASVKLLQVEYHWHLKAWYILRLPPGKVRKELCIAPAEVIEHIHKAREMLRKRLTRNDELA